MPDRRSILLIVLLSAACGGLLDHLLMVRLRSGDSSPASSHNDGMAEQLALHLQRVDRGRQALAAISGDNDFLVRERSQRRASLPAAGTLPANLAAFPAETAKVQLQQLIRMDDRLLAELVLERSRTKQLHAHFDSLNAAYRNQVNALKRTMDQQQQLARRRKWQTIATVATVSAAVAVLLSHS